MSFSVTQVGIPDNAVTSAKIAPNAVVSDDLAVNTVQYAEVEISSAEIKNLFTAAKQLVATPGAGKVLEFISLLLALDYTAPVYTVEGCGTLQVHYTNLAGAVVSVAQAASFLEANADAMMALDKLEANVVPVVNTPLVLAIADANPLAGGSTIHAKVAYRIHATGL